MLIASLRLLCRTLAKPMRGYPQLKALTPPVDGYDKKTPEQHEWLYTPPGVDGWKFLEERNLSRTVLKSLWDEEGLEIQQIDAKGEWHDVFVL